MALTIRPGKYRGQDGYRLRGDGVVAWVETKATAEHIRDLMKAGRAEQPEDWSPDPAGWALADVIRANKLANEARQTIKALRHEIGYLSDLVTITDLRLEEAEVVLEDVRWWTEQEIWRRKNVRLWTSAENIRQTKETP
jgi:hypothetical protein